MTIQRFANMTNYMALISGRVYPSLGLAKPPRSRLTVLIVARAGGAPIPAVEASRREPAQALHHV